MVKVNIWFSVFVIVILLWFGVFKAGDSNKDLSSRNSLFFGGKEKKLEKEEITKKNKKPKSQLEENGENEEKKVKDPLNEFKEKGNVYENKKSLASSTEKTKFRKFDSFLKYCQNIRENMNPKETDTEEILKTKELFFSKKIHFEHDGLNCLDVLYHIKEILDLNLEIDLESSKFAEEELKKEPWLKKEYRHDGFVEEDFKRILRLARLSYLFEKDGKIIIYKPKILTSAESRRLKIRENKPKVF